MTRAERVWMSDAARLGCVVCLMQGRGYVPAAIHHLLSGGRRIGHLDSIALCDPGHHKSAPAGSGEVSRHPSLAAFEARYGTEAFLLAHSRRLVEAARERAA